MIAPIDDNWKKLLQEEFQKKYFKDLREFVKKEYEQHTCFPERKQIFAALNRCSLQNIKVVIIGQDPYHGIGQANGLCFSVQENIALPPSLINIFKEIETDIGTAFPKNGNLERWADQGVLLLNATLTVRAHEAGSHQRKGWEKFTDALIKKVSDEKSGVIFLLWGGYARKKEKLIDTSKNHVLASGHPSPLSANRGHWYGNRHFSKTNQLLIQQKKQPIVW